MFGIFRRLKELERDVCKLLQADRCKNGYHDWEYTSGSFSGVVIRNDWVEGRKCKHCREFVELKKVKED